MKSHLLEPAIRLEKIAAAFEPKVAMARGVLILDENLLFLQSALEAKHFKVTTLPTGKKDPEIAPLLWHRIFVTNNADDFREAAAVYEFSIIDTAKTYQDPDSLADQISEAWIRMSLKGKQPFMLRLKRKGPPTLEAIE